MVVLPNRNDYELCGNNREFGAMHRAPASFSACESNGLSVEERSTVRQVLRLLLLIGPIRDKMPRVVEMWIK